MDIGCGYDDLSAKTHLVVYIYIYHRQPYELVQSSTSCNTEYFLIV